jgi:hypothetical protein
MIRNRVWLEFGYFAPPGSIRSGRTIQSSSPSIHEPVFAREVAQRGLRPRAEMLDNLGRRQRAEPAGILVTGIAHQPEQESGGKQIAGTGGVDKLRNREGRHGGDAVG